MRCTGSPVTGLCSHRKEDSLDSLIHLSWDVRAVWLAEGGRVENKRAMDELLSSFEMWKRWIYVLAE